MNETRFPAIYPPSSPGTTAPPQPEVAEAPASSIPDTDTPVPTLAERVAGFFHARAVSPDSLATVGLVLSGGAAFVFFTDHPGMAAIVGCVALVLAKISIFPAPQMPLAGDLRGRLFLPLTHLLMLAGLLAGVAERHAPVVAFTALLLLVVSAWIPLLEAHARFRGTSLLGALWGATDRLAVVLLGALTGRLTAGLVVALLMGAFEAWRLLDRMQSPAGFAPSDQWLTRHKIVGADQEVSPLARWGVLALAALALFLLPASPAWRF